MSLKFNQNLHNTSADFIEKNMYAYNAFILT